MAYKNIAVVGAAGNIGKPITQGLIQSGLFNVTVIARSTSTSPVPHGVKYIKVDFQSHAALVSALRGQDVLLVTIGDGPDTVARVERSLIDASVAAGVKRYLPSNYGSDYSTLPGKDQPLFAKKVKLEEYLRDLAGQGKLTWTSIACGAFLELGIRTPFIGFDIKNRKFRQYDDGNRKWDAITYASIADAVVSILGRTDPALTANKTIRIHDFYISQNDIYSYMSDKYGRFDIDLVDLDKLLRDSLEKYKRGDRSGIMGLVVAYVMGRQSSCAWGDADDSEMLGLYKKDLREELSKITAGME